MATVKTFKIPTSLSDSARFQSALRSNNLEHIRMLQKRKKMQFLEDRRESHYFQSNKSLYEWAQEVRKTTGTTFSEHPDKLFIKQEKKKEDDNVAPSCYFAYGMRIGERPQLMKNFIGRPPGSKRRTRVSRRKDERLPDKNEVSIINEEIPQQVYSYFGNKLKERETERQIRRGYKTFMYGNKVITQVPIGYSRDCRRPRTCFSASSSEQFKPENVVLPPYHFMKYHGLLPPVDMFR